MVVNHIENHFNSSLVQFCYRFTQLTNGIFGGGVSGVRRRESERVITPMIFATASIYRRFRNKLMDWQELERSNSKGLEISDGAGVTQSLIGAAFILGNLMIELGEAADMCLINDCLGPVNDRASIRDPATCNNN